LGRVEEGAGEGDAAGVEVSILIDQCGEATGQQAGDDEERDGAGDLGGDEEMAGALTFASAGDAGGAGLQRRLRIDAHRAQSREQSEEKRGEDGEAGGGEEHGPRDVNVVDAGEALRRCGNEHLDTGEGEENAERATDEGEDE